MERLSSVLALFFFASVITFEINVEYHFVHTMNNADGDYIDNSQHITNHGDGNVRFNSQFKQREANSNKHSGSAVCCASNTRGACCASAAEAAQYANTSSEFPDSMLFSKKYELLKRPAWPQPAQSTVAIEFCSTSVGCW